MPASPDALQCQLHKLWSVKAEGGAVPLRRAFDAVELRAWLGFLSLIDVEDVGGDFRYRVFGTRLVGLVGQELTGLRLSQADPMLAAAVRPGYLAVLRTAVPATFDMVLEGDWHAVRLRDLVLPISSDGARVDMLLTCTYPI
ncbi:MAG: PAS domain-containing protein [Alphaproteobacteria bacterium]